MSEARDAILSAIRRSPTAPELGGDPWNPTGVARGYRRKGRMDSAGLMDLLEDRLKDYQASVSRCSVPELSRVVAERLNSLSGGVVVAPRDLPQGWLTGVPEGEILIRRDQDPDALGTTDLAAARGAVSGCSLAIAETGTLVLASGATEGRRAITLLPDYHLCVVFSHQVVETVPEGVDEIRALAVDDRAPITLVSGPSATSDIELIRVEGVHGPRTLDVILVENPQGDDT